MSHGSGGVPRSGPRLDEKGRGWRSDTGGMAGSGSQPLAADVIGQTTGDGRAVVAVFSSKWMQCNMAAGGVDCAANTRRTRRTQAGLLTELPARLEAVWWVWSLGDCGPCTVRAPQVQPRSTTNSTPSPHPRRRTPPSQRPPSIFSPVPAADCGIESLHALLPASRFGLFPSPHLSHALGPGATRHVSTPRPTPGPHLPEATPCLSPMQPPWRLPKPPALAPAS